MLYLSGDLHHYERRPLGESLHVIAGGGGAFLHGTRIPPSPLGPAARVYPDAAISRRLALGLPWKLMAGTAGVPPAHALRASRGDPAPGPRAQPRERGP